MHAQSQQYAGEEKIGCSGPGAVIGIDNPNPDHCYLWAVADGLTEEQVNQKQPLVHPGETTWYTVTVTDQNFSFKAIDRVRVVIFFGGIKFHPKYIYPNGEANQTKATLTSNGYGTEFPSESFTWSVESDPDNTGAVISADGWISNCTQPGKVTIRATKNSNPACYAEEVIEVNVGVKDVIVRDMDNAGREAHAGDTLYVVGIGDIEFEAIPNDESSFPPNQPEWSGSITPPGGNDYLWTADISEGTTYTVTAGDKTVTVTRLAPNTVTIQRDIDIKPIKDFMDKFKKFTAAIQNPLCTPIPVGVVLPTNFTGGVKFERVGKYQNPDYGYKTEFSAELPVVGVAGCAPFLPCCGVVVGVPLGGNALIFPYARFNSSISLTGAVAKDPSAENSNWVGTITFAGKLELAAGVAVDISFVGMGLTGGGETLTKFEAAARLQNDKIEHQETWGGLQAQFTGSVYFGSPSNPSWAVKAGLGPFNLLDGAQTPWTQLVDLSD